MLRHNPIYLQELQDVFEQLEHAEVPAKGFSVPVAENTENFFLISFELHFGQFISEFPKTNLSNSSPQF